MRIADKEALKDDAGFAVAAEVVSPVVYQTNGSTRT